ncbi:MAG: S8 family serine peptidase [Methylotenera sp.]|nr:S8 family serine peptidase [Oligoflexia bacterium]
MQHRKNNGNQNTAFRTVVVSIAFLTGVTLAQHNTAKADQLGKCDYSSFTCGGGITTSRDVPSPESDYNIQRGYLFLKEDGTPLRENTECKGYVTPPFSLAGIERTVGSRMEHKGIDIRFLDNKKFYIPRKDMRYVQRLLAPQSALSYLTPQEIATKVITSISTPGGGATPCTGSHEQNAASLIMDFALADWIGEGSSSRGVICSGGFDLADCLTQFNQHMNTYDTTSLSSFRYSSIPGSVPLTTLRGIRSFPTGLGFNKAQNKRACLNTSTLPTENSFLVNGPSPRDIQDYNRKQSAPENRIRVYSSSITAAYGSIAGDSTFSIFQAAGNTFHGYLAYPNADGTTVGPPPDFIKLSPESFIIGGGPVTLNAPNHAIPAGLLIIANGAEEQRQRLSLSSLGGPVAYYVPIGREVMTASNRDEDGPTPKGPSAETPKEVGPAFNGTSAAAPMAASVYATLFKVDPKLSSDQARAIMAGTARKEFSNQVVNGIPTQINNYGWGVPNAPMATMVARYFKTRQAEDPTSFPRGHEAANRKRAYDISNVIRNRILRAFRSEKLLKTSPHTVGSILAEPLVGTYVDPILADSNRGRPFTLTYEGVLKAGTDCNAMNDLFESLHLAYLLSGGAPELRQELCLAYSDYFYLSSAKRYFCP